MLAKRQLLLRREVLSWSLLERAVDEKIGQQREFVRWWAETVTPRKHLNRHSVDSADRRYLKQGDAESLTGITHQQVSKWRGKLERMAAEIRLRAKRRIGELSEALETSPGARTDIEPLANAGERLKLVALKDAGISTSEARRCEKL